LFALSSLTPTELDDKYIQYYDLHYDRVMKAQRALRQYATDEVKRVIGFNRKENVVVYSRERTDEEREEDFEADTRRAAEESLEFAFHPPSDEDRVGGGGSCVRQHVGPA
jgi:hypothetical protein